jgi:hypothetical protein
MQRDIIRLQHQQGWSVERLAEHYFYYAVEVVKRIISQPLEDRAREGVKAGCGGSTGREAPVRSWVWGVSPGHPAMGQSGVQKASAARVTDPRVSPRHRRMNSVRSTGTD